ncbi:MAG: COG4705 family protein [Gemmatimonadaceae bacterium]
MTATTERDLRPMLNKVPEVFVVFWILKILATTVGETAADVLSTTFGLGTVNTSYVMGVLLLISIFFQFRARKYEPPIYWLVVVFISVVGTLISDNLVDNLGVSLVTTTIIFTIALIAVFVIWYATEKTLSVHTIYTFGREFYYWLAILFTFSLGTSGGDLLSERLGLGYALSGVMFAAAIAVIYGLYRARVIGEVLAFWLAYILTRPLGASIGDLLTQTPKDGGLGLGTIPVSAVFLLVILALVVKLTRDEKRRLAAEGLGGQ